ncbi:hypothetical protein OJF2_55780 [Aquisphaera giovannonii]|uniref:Uncharacterized protein n=1 Tax=Aquisphaera giovannonii TaxID=406548 RepID=A0A5B9W8Z5_9BACT|nr:hypothetical protein [Aquisphaera giovannonii]QEH36993.1 hypothetical protein OJF2_55780 [Aquisphaera giovannonii]
MWSRRAKIGLLAAVLAAGFGAVSPARAQNRDLAFDSVVGRPRGLPDLPPEGAWGEIINVTSRWIVVQNHSGQQFPIAVDDMREFLIRWPYRFDDLNQQSVIEAVGQDAGSNVVRTEHVDVFEGDDRDLVSPTYNSLLPNNMVVTTLDPGFNRYMNAWDYAGQNMLYGWAYPVPANTNGIPSKLHVVGSVEGLQQGPLVRVGLPGNNWATIVPDASGQMTITQITRGTTNLTKKGDTAFLMPLQITPRGLIVSQLVVYKQMTYRQFRANPNARPDANANANGNNNR